MIVTSDDLGMNTSGGSVSTSACLLHGLLKSLQGLTLRESMISGTAGFTAALSISRLTDFGMDKGEEVLVTGASGGEAASLFPFSSDAGFNRDGVNSSSGRKGISLGIGAAR